MLSSHEDPRARARRRDGAPPGTSALLVLFALLSSLWSAGVRADDAPDWEEASEAEQPVEAESEAPAKVVRISPSVAGSQALSSGADRDLARVEQELLDVQRHTRAYFASWLLGHAALIGGSVYIVTSFDHDPKMQDAFKVNVALSSAMLLYHLVQGWPALGSHRRFKRLPSGTLEEKVAKATYGERVIAEQLHKDRIATTIERHLGVLGAAVALGAGVGLYLQSIKEGLSLGIGVLAIGELVILSRPHTYHGPADHSPKSSLALLPMVDKHVRGLGLGARF